MMQIQKNIKIKNPIQTLILNFSLFKITTKKRKMIQTLEFSLNGAELSVNSGNQINHWSMNWGQFKDPVSHMCLAGAVVASWLLTQEVSGSNPFK